jgi:small-conductance mechanosensitive channel
MQEILQREFLQNTVADYLLAIAIIIVGAIAVNVLRTIALSQLKRWASRTSTNLDDALLRIFERALIPLLYLGVFYISVGNLTLHPIVDRALNSVVVITATILGIRLVVALAEYAIRIYWVTRESSPNLEQSLSALVPAIRTVVWALGIVFLLDNLGFDISAVIAGLGIGGVAVALASQGLLQDLFSYFSILFDRPFEIGDFIIVGDFIGTVEQVGIKTTRLQSLSGEELIMANTDLTNSRIRNFKRMEERRIAFQIGVTYETGLSMLEEIPTIISQIIYETVNVRFDRAHFLSYGDFSLNFEIVYYVTSSDYTQYMDAQQHINLEMKKAFEERGIKFAYPTQVTYLNNLAGDRVAVEINGNGSQQKQAIEQPAN